MAIWSARARRGIVGFLASVACIVLLSNCASIAVATLQAIYADPRTKVHAYDMRLDVSFRLGNEVVHAVRYGAVTYFDGKGDYRYQPCNKSKKLCWTITWQYFVVLENGDIVTVQVDSTKLPLKDMRPGESVHAEGMLFEIYRDRPREDGKGLSCSTLSELELGKFYGLPPHRQGHDVEVAALDIEIVATRALESEGRHRILDPYDIHQNSLEHSCGQLAKRIPAEPSAK